VGNTFPFGGPQVEGAANETHRVEVVLREHDGHVGGLVGAHAMLAGDRSAVSHAEPQDLASELLGRRLLPGDGAVVEDERMEIPVAGVKDVGDAESDRGCERVDLPKDARRARDDPSPK
jgi:hypothetical protein